jgi:hypothetical protein
MGSCPSAQAIEQAENFTTSSAGFNNFSCLSFLFTSIVSS